MLPDREVQSELHRLALTLHRDNPGLKWVQLPFHVSLKQSFATEDVAAIEEYFMHFASTLPIQTVVMGRPEIVDGSIFWIPVMRDALRPLHDQLNRDLVGIVSDPSAPFDGPTYRFHLSLGFLGGSASSPILPRHIGINDPKLALRKAALFLFDEYEEGLWQFTTYRTMGLGRAV